jgi:hypothetical protein
MTRPSSNRPSALPERHGGDVTRTAQELGLNHWTLRDWMQAERDKNQPPPPALTLAETQAERANLAAAGPSGAEPLRGLLHAHGPQQPVEPLGQRCPARWP